MAGKRRAEGPAVKRPASKPVPASGRTRLKALLKWSVIVGVVLAVLGATTVAILYKAIDIPEPNAAFQEETSFVYYADGKSEAGRFVADQDRNSVPYDQIPQHMKNAVVAAEDRSFWSNNGIDVKGILRAAFSNIRGNSTQGASTITQQYVKVLYLTQERTYKRKVKEAIVARKLADEQSKDQVLEGYLNTIYFGRGAYGIDAAADHYFNTEAKNLNLRQSAVLASVINNPSQFDPANGDAQRAALERRYGHVLRGMNEMGDISATQMTQAAEQLPKFPKVKAEASYGGQRGHVLELVKRELLRTGKVTEDQIIGGGLRIHTTLSKKAMRAAEQGVMEQQPKGLKGLHTAVASVEPGTGALRGFFGGHDYLDSQVNWAVSGGQPGSSFKPFALAAGLTAGYSLKDTFDGNSPYLLPDGTDVENQGEGFGSDQGAAISLTRATEKSVNTAYVDLTLGLPNGPADVVSMATKMGIPKNNGDNTMDRLHNSPGLDANTTVALGSASVSPINMANAYATIANGGERAGVYVIEKVEDKTGEVLYRHKVRTKRVLEEDIASDVSYALQKVVETPDASGTKAQALGRPAAGKTGTATAGDDSHVSSSWFVGYTPQLSTAVMYVRGRGQESLEGFLEPFYGGTYPALTWTAVMQRALEGVEVEDFPEPAFVDGDAPEDGHAPYTPPPPPPKKTKKPTKKPTKTQEPTPTVEPSPTETVTLPSPTNPPGPDCSIFTNHPSCTTAPEPEPSVDDGNNGGGNNPQLAYREEYARP